VAVETVMECDNIETIKRIVEIEAGVSIVPHATITQEVAQKTLAQVKIEGRNLYQPVAAIYKKNKALTPAMKKFLAMLKS
jgi:DNA-binding transcriptional LysR family regulator